MARLFPPKASAPCSLMERLPAERNIPVNRNRLPIQNRTKNTNWSQFWWRKRCWAILQPTTGADGRGLLIWAITCVTDAPPPPSCRDSNTDGSGGGWRHLHIVSVVLLWTSMQRNGEMLETVWKRKQIKVKSSQNLQVNQKVPPATSSRSKFKNLIQRWR